MRARHHREGRKTMRPLNRFVWLLTALTLVPVLLCGNGAQARSLAEIRDSGVIKIGIREDIPPIQYRDQKGELVGIDPDLGRALADALGVKPEWVMLAGPKFREEVLLQRKVDLVISSFSITRERLEVIDFSNPYFTTGLAVMIKAGDQAKIQSYTDLAGKTVTATRGSTGERLISELVPDASFFFVTGTAETYGALRSGKADALINDKVFLDHAAAQSPDLYVLDGTLSADQYGIGVAKGDHGLLIFVNDFLSRMKADGKPARLIGKYSKFDPSLEPEAIKGGTLASYVVKPGDTLSRIALQFYGDPTRWPIIYAANRDTVKYANVLNVGLELKIPSPAPAAGAVAPAKEPSAGPSTRDGLKGKLKEAEELYKGGLIDRKEYEELKKALLKRFMEN
jgi:ABC-type amino acid transport substrate-binding protein/phage tail protein X